eukprot:CAMPEP_0177711432 /NCGR_PEP_ID=MMETSP0484_2-20121128/11858_1 /TAXON_ID=354590 /ORGANISM="Rhodomonas lens, Strain RHODO" /LENGTH=305 /DNA_ID=CAMNT_0019223165 /DNA_START=60 /DNA_END=974 /DNA_ORIENTATION=-
MEVGYYVSRTAMQDPDDSVVRAVPYWRAPIANLSDLSGTKRRSAVALSLLGTQVDELVRIVGVTLLPEGLFGKITQLVFCPRDLKLRVCANESISEFEAVMIGKTKIQLQPFLLSLQDFGTVNLVRRFVSDAVAGVGSTKGVLSQRHVLSQLMQLLLRPIPSNTESKEEKEGSEKKGRKTQNGVLAVDDGDMNRTSSVGLAVESGSDPVTTRWIPCCLEESKDFLPQVRMDFEAAQREYEEEMRLQAEGGGEADPADSTVASTTTGGKGVAVTTLGLPGLRLVGNGVVVGGDGAKSKGGEGGKAE